MDYRAACIAAFLVDIRRENRECTGHVECFDQVTEMVHRRLEDCA